MNIVFVCIGTPKVIGDSIGPKVGDYLIKKNAEVIVYGTTQRPITAVNVEQYYSLIEKKHKGDIIIAIDSALGNKSEIGKIKIKPSGVHPGRAFGKNINVIGDIGVLAIVGDKDKNKFKELEQVKESEVLSFVSSIIEVIESTYILIRERVNI